MPWPEAEPAGHAAAAPLPPVLDFIAQHYPLVAGLTFIAAIAMPLWRPTRPRARAARQHLIYAAKVYGYIALFIGVLLWSVAYNFHPAGIFMVVAAVIGMAPFLLPFLAVIIVIIGQLLYKETPS